MDCETRWFRLKKKGRMLIVDSSFGSGCDILPYDLLLVYKFWTQYTRFLSLILL